MHLGRVGGCGKGREREGWSLGEARVCMRLDGLLVRVLATLLLRGYSLSASCSLQFSFNNVSPDDVIEFHVSWQPVH